MLKLAFPFDRKINFEDLQLRFAEFNHGFLFKLNTDIFLDLVRSGNYIHVFWTVCFLNEIPIFPHFEYPRDL